jgi:general secretion pathway protein K
MTRKHHRDIDARPKATNSASEQGLALLAVLWIIASATLLVASFNVNVRSGLSFIRSEVKLSQSENLLDAGLEIAVTRLIDEEASRQWHPDGQWRTIAFAGSSLRIRIQDPNGLVDLNKADEKLLLEFFKRFGANANQAKLITDRIIIARGQKPGADADKSGDADRAAKPALSSPFMDVGQLRQIEGMSIDLFRRVAPFMTVFSFDGSINPLTAPAEVFAVSGAGRDERARREAFQSGQAGQAGRSVSSKSDGAEIKADDFGPAYAITIEAATVDNNYNASKTFVIATGLDQSLPYRLLSVRPVPDQR